MEEYGQYKRQLLRGADGKVRKTKSGRKRYVLNHTKSKARVGSNVVATKSDCKRALSDGKSMRVSKAAIEALYHAERKSTRIAHQAANNARHAKRKTVLETDVLLAQKQED